VIVPVPAVNVPISTDIMYSIPGMMVIPVEGANAPVPFDQCVATHPDIAHPVGALHPVPLAKVPFVTISDPRV